jgi:phosphoserine phosphatase
LDSSSYKLIVFDCDGVLVDGHTSFFVAQELGLGMKVKKIYRDLLTGSKTFSQAINEGHKLFIGVKEKDVLPIMMGIPLIKGVEHTIRALKKAGLIVGTISTGGSQYFVDILKNRLDLDFAIGTGVRIIDGVLFGIKEPIINMENKVFYLTKVVENYGFGLKDCVAVGDDLSNLSLFKKVGLSISFNVDCLRRELQSLDVSLKEKIFSNIKLVLAEIRVKRNSKFVIRGKSLDHILTILGLGQPLL